MNISFIYNGEGIKSITDKDIKVDSLQEGDIYCINTIAYKILKIEHVINGCASCKVYLTLEPGPPTINPV